MADVEYRARFTRNMGNFESLQVEIGVGDGALGDEKAGETFNRLKDFVESRLLEGIEELELQVIGVREQVIKDFRAWQAKQGK